MEFDRVGVPQTRLWHGEPDRRAASGLIDPDHGHRRRPATASSASSTSGPRATARWTRTKL